ncbi:MAG: glycoside hydrolase family 2 [Rikenellaceae bacterium]|nr:glycoside hydrolase family 2 [Rikenellaceae bacterium]
MKRLLWGIGCLLCAFGAGAQTPEWQNPGIPSTHKAPLRAEFISYDLREAATAGDRSKSPHYLLLAGNWRAHAVDRPADRIEGFNRPMFSVARWDERAVPCLDAAPARSGLDGLTPPRLPGTNPTVQYRAEIEVPYMWLDRDMFIHIEGAQSGYYLWVNDRLVGYCEDTRTPAEFEITKYVTDGLNSIGIEVIGYTTGAWLETLNRPAAAPGALGTVYVYSQPKVRIEDFIVSTRSDARRIDGLLDIDVALSNSYNDTEPLIVGFDIYAPSGKLFTYNQKEITLSNYGKDTVRFSEAIYGAIKDWPWSPAKPNLYKAMLYIKRDGRMIEYIPFRIGFHDTSFADGTILLRGQPLEIKAARYNAAADRKTTSAEIATLKKQGINTLCTDYPQPGWFYGLCDEQGLWVIDQANLNSGFRPEDRNAGGTTANDPAWLASYLDRSASLIPRSRNHTCIIGWSMGGDAGNGYNLYKSYQLLKQMDTVRPIIYMGAAGEWNTDMEYPAAQDARTILDQAARDAAKAPAKGRKPAPRRK